jgi:hypothetical protein
LDATVPTAADGVAGDAMQQQQQQQQQHQQQAGAQQEGPKQQQQQGSVALPPAAGTEAGMAAASAAATVPAVPGEVPAGASEAQELELQLYADFLRIVLEVRYQHMCGTTRMVLPCHMHASRGCDTSARSSTAYCVAYTPITWQAFQADVLLHARVCAAAMPACLLSHVPPTLSASPLPSCACAAADHQRHPHQRPAPEPRACVHPAAQTGTSVCVRWGGREGPVGRARDSQSVAWQVFAGTSPPVLLACLLCRRCSVPAAVLLLSHAEPKKDAAPLPSFLLCAAAALLLSVPRLLCLLPQVCSCGLSAGRLQLIVLLMLAGGVCPLCGSPPLL